jgi:exosortase D (VPLPA-CTERM-specific)
MIKILQTVKPIAWVKLVLYAAALAGIYYSALQRLVGHDWEMEDFNYCYLIPFVVVYFIWEKRDGLMAMPSRVSLSGFLPVCLGLLLFWLGELGGEFFTLYISFWIVVVGLIWVHIGWEKLKVIWFAVVMMLGMFPLPNIINVRLTFGLKLISSQIGVALLRLYGMSAYREGNVIDLGFTQLQVVEACSGLRYVMPLLVLSLILAYWYKAHVWKRLVLVVSSVPIAIFVNSFRIAATGVLYSAWGAQVAEGFFHGFSGWLIFMFTIPVLLAEMWVLGKLPPRGPKDDEEGPQQGSIQTGNAADVKPGLMQPVFLVAIAILALTFVVSKGVDFREKIPIKVSFKEFPTQIGEWSGSRQQMEQEFIDALHFSDYAMIDYRNAEDKVISFYTAYYESQRKGEATHSPETCLPGSGWVFKEAGTAKVALHSGRSFPVKRAFIEKGGARQLTYYWFAQRGRVLTNLYQVKFYSFWDALTRHRTDGALVRLITPVYQNEEPKDAEKRLEGFVAVMQPILKRYIPE